MRVNITDEIISEFFSGAIVVLALIGMGAFLLFLLKGMKRTFPFARMGLAMGLAPLSLINFLDYSNGNALFFYSMAAALLGIIIDGINHLLTPKEVVKVTPEVMTKEEPVEEEKVEPGPGMIVWEKAE
jgi:hypothetical protein